MNDEEITFRETECRPMGYVLSLDLGQAADFTAATVNEWAEGQLLTMRKKPWQAEPVQIGARRLIKHRIRFLHRYALGTPYTAIADSAKGLLAQLPPMPRKPELWADATGVGRAVIDIFRHQAGLNPVAVTITAGDQARRISPTELRVPKRELASLTQACLQTGRIEVSPALPLAKILEDELASFKVKITSGGNETFEGRSGVHDDLVLSLAIAAWAAEKGSEVPGAALLELARRELAQMRGEPVDQPTSREEARCPHQPGSMEHSAWEQARLTAGQ